MLILFDLILVAGYLGHELFWQGRGYALRVLDLNGEHSVAAWYSSTKLAAVAVLFAVCGVVLKGRDIRKGTWAVMGLGGLFMLMSIDEAVQVHEEIGKRADALLLSDGRANSWFSMTGIWVFVVAPPAVVALVWCFLRARRAWAGVPGVGVRLALGLTVFLAGAVLIEVFSNVSTAPSWLLMQIAIEEGFEMLGVSLVLWAALDTAVYAITGEVDHARPAQEGSEAMPDAQPVAA
ncbi:MAG: hypothetical protein AAF797_09590 [Planctomycetota bacterium]